MLSTEERCYQIDIIREYGGIKNCNCKNCSDCDDDQIEECYSVAGKKYGSRFAELINYGGYEFEEEFWENI